MDTLQEDNDFVLLRERRESDGSPVLIKTFDQDYAISIGFDSSWAVHPIEHSNINGRITVIFSDPGGETLDRILRKPLELEEALRIAIGITAAIGRLHERHFIHKDIKPANIMVDRAKGEIHLMGFGLASRLPHERQDPVAPEMIAGTLAYMAPEQTGRMNRSMDSRSDLYSLGVTLYQMLTGELPFTAKDPLEWVHCHIARQPMLPAERMPVIPL